MMKASRALGTSLAPSLDHHQASRRRQNLGPCLTKMHDPVGIGDQPPCPERALKDRSNAPVVRRAAAVPTPLARRTPPDQLAILPGRELQLRRLHYLRQSLAHA